MNTFADASGGEFNGSSSQADITSSISNIRLEVDTAPVISNVAAGGITATGATITWTTNENSDSQVEYGTTTSYGQLTTLNPTLVTAHSQALSGLTAGTLYHYRVKSGDATGNLAVSGDFTFTTAPDTTPPTITSFSPAAGATNVNANANVTVIFSEAMNPATVNGSTIELRDPSNALIPATVSYNAASFTATLDPTASLLPGVTYTARVRGGGTDPRVKDVAGNALATDVTRTFTTLSWTGWPANLNMALIDPINRIGLPGEDLLSRNYNWSLPLLSLPGRAGLDLGLALSLNSLVYTKAGSVIYFDPEQGYPAPGFKLGFPEIRNAFFNTDASAQSYLLSMPSGRRVEFRQINTNVYEAVDSSYMLLTCDPVNSVFVLYTTDGTQCRFVDVTGSGDYKCVQIKDRHGNYITISYGSLAEIRTVTDTLGRVINFNYDGFNHLNSITQNWGGQTHTWATFAYGTQTIQTNFPGLTLNGTTNGTTVLMRVGLADGSVYSFDYNTYAQVKTIRRYAPNISNPVNFPGDYFQRAYTTYGLPDNANDPQTDCPRITSRIDWAADWNSGVTSTYDAEPGHAWGQVTFPDGTIYKEFFATIGWQRGLTTQTENWSAGVRKKWTTLQWTQDNTGVSYRLNPRVMETNVYDDVGNRRRTTTSYTSFGLASDAYEYDTDGTTVLRRTHTDYNLSADYTNRRIIGLPSAEYLYDGNNTLYSKVTYEYDLNPNPYLQHQGPPVQHDTANYGPGFVEGRGNLNVVRRWDVTDPNNALKASEYETGYNTSGSVIFTRDPLDHQTSVSYADSFSDGQNHSTYAYPTTTTDPDNFSSTVQYNYDFGAVTRAQDPKGAAVTRTYDAARRIERITNVVNGAYTRYVYGLNQSYVQSYTTINDLSAEFYSITVFDGHDRVRATTSDHPTSVGQYKAQYNVYDVIGRLAQQTNPTEINSSWQPAGDDAGWVWSYQTYDWQGRPTVATDQEGNTKEFLYGGCGCAGGQVVVTRDEAGRRQKMTYDALGRLKMTQALFIQPKDQPLNGDGDVYSTQVNAYNARDQITQVNQITQSGGASQITTRQYDGHGRLWKQRAPIESGDTVYEYYADDTIFRVTDARQAAAIFTYYGRHLTQDVTYTVPAGVAATPNVHYAYDENGNRTQMNDGLGTVTYSYDTLSRMGSETRYFTELAKSYSLTYAYNLAGQVERVSFESPSFPGDNTHVYYDHNKAGEMTAVTGSPYAGVTQYVTEMKYRAWGEAKSLRYGNNRTLAAGYDARRQLQSLQLKKQDDTKEMDKVYQYYPDGRIKFSGDSLYNRQFDRAFSYDHVGRLQEGWAGIQARNFINQVPVGTDTVPYHLVYQYDVWGNRLSQTGKVWSAADFNESQTYQDNRRSGWQYDAAGNVISDGAIPFQYDAAGRNVSVGSGFSTSTEAFDGDGLGVRRDPYAPSHFANDSPPIFYMRSTVLGGKVIAEINGMDPSAIAAIPRGGKLQSYVYHGESLVAEQQLVNLPLTQRLEWRQVDPVTGTQLRTADSGDSMLRREEPDPQGVHVGFADPAEIPPPPPDGEQPSYFGVGGWDPNRPTFTLDGILVDELFVIELFTSNAVVVAPAEEYITIIRNGKPQLARFQAYADGYQGYVPVGAKYLGNGQIGSGGAGLFKDSLGGTLYARSSRRGDTDLATINGATGDEAELGRSSDFAFAFGPQAQRQQRGGGGNRNLQKKEKKEPCNPGFFNEAQTYNVNNDSVHNFTGSDINVGARVIYGEAAGSLAGGTDEETDALASVLYNRIGAKGFRGGVQQTFQGVAYAPKQFESVTTPGRTKKFDSSAPGDYQNLSPGECNDLRRAVDAIKRLLESGPKYGYLYNLGGTKGPGDVIGGSRFFVSRKF